MHTIRLDANSRRSRIRGKWCVVLLPFSLSSLLQVTRFPFRGRRRFSLTIHLLLTLILFIEKSGWLANFFKRNAKFNWFRTTLWRRFDTELREGIAETRIQRAQRHDNQVIAKQWRAKGTARSTTQPSTVQANRWAVPPVYGQWRITRVFYSGQQVWTIQASDVACRSGNRSHASFFPNIKYFYFPIFFYLFKLSTTVWIFLPFIKLLYRFILYFELSFITFSYVTLNMKKVGKIFIFFILLYHMNYKRYFRICFKLKIEFFYENKWNKWSRNKSMLLEYYTTSVFTVSWQSWVNLDSCYFMWKLKLILLYIVTWIIKIWFEYWILKYNYYLLITIQTNTLKFLKYIHICVQYDTD